MNIPKIISVCEFMKCEKKIRELGNLPHRIVIDAKAPPDIQKWNQNVSIDAEFSDN
jgi:hypothetical protein